MGMFDTVTIEEGLDVEFPELDRDPTSIDWQTKTLGRPAMETYKITADGRLLKEDAHYETVPEEDRPRYDEELGGFEEDWEEVCGMMTKVHEGWSDTEHHGIVEVHTSIDKQYISYDLKFTDGELVDVSRNKRN